MTHGIHLVWSTYGTWLPGDDRGHWSPLFGLYGNIHERGGKLNLPDETTRAKVRELMKESPKILDEAEQLAVAEEIGTHVQLPNVVAWAAAVEPNHVHLLIGPIDEDISIFAGRLKGTSSSAMGRFSQNRNRQRIWTKGFWKAFLFDEFGVLAVKAYIDDHNVRRGRSSFPWITQYRPI